MNQLRSTIARIAALFLFLLTIGFAVVAQDQPLKINYRLAMPHPNSHLFEVSIEVESPADAGLYSLDFQMPQWSPGRYAVFDFAKNVQEFGIKEMPPPNAQCAEGANQLKRVDTQTWRVFLCKANSVTVSYKVFANDLSGTFSQLDSRHANFNGGCVFMYVVNHKQDPVLLSIDPPKDWRIVNGRTDKADQRDWQFPNWDIMIDTPTEVAPDWTEDNFKVDGKQYHASMHPVKHQSRIVVTFNFS